MPQRSIKFFALCGNSRELWGSCISPISRTVIKISIFLLCVVCLCIVSADAEKNRWYLYYTKPAGIEHYYDVKSIVRTYKAIPKTQALTKNRVRTREKYAKVLLVKIREKLVFNNPEYSVKESRILREIDCSRNMIRTLMTSKTYKTGFKKIEGKTQPWEDISSNPSYESLYEIVCKP